MNGYRKLLPENILNTLALLQLRIEERFPGAGLGKVCAELHEMARCAKTKAARIARPNLWLRALAIIIISFGALALYYVGSIVHFNHNSENLFGVVQGVEAFINLLIVTGAAVFFLWSLEARWKRHRALHDLYELRSLVHVIDMHQLTKDPSSHAKVSAPTKHSPSHSLSSYELMRYLDYCSEMLSLTAKVGVLYAQGFRDPIVLGAVGDLGQITTNLTNKIWQKITIIQASEDWQTGMAEQVAAGEAG